MNPKTQEMNVSSEFSVNSISEILPSINEYKMISNNASETKRGLIKMTFEDTEGKDGSPNTAKL